MSKTTSHKTIRFTLVGLIIIYSLLTFESKPVSASHMTIKAGLPDAHPVQSFDEHNHPVGIFPNFIIALAHQKGWQVKFIPLSFSEGLRRLQNGEIDLLSPVAYSAVRSKELEFTDETILTDFGRIYTRNNIKIKSILDLSGKKIAVPKNGMMYIGPKGLKAILHDFNLPCTIIEKNTFEEVMQMVSMGDADAGIASRITGNRFEEIFKIERTPIVFSPVQLRIAFPINGAHTKELKKSIDETIRQMKADEGSVLNESFAQLFGAEVATRKIIPQWLMIIVLLTSGSLAIVAIFSVILRRQVRIRTRELADSEARFRALIEASTDIIWVIDPHFKCSYVSPAFEHLVGFAPSEAIGKPLTFFQISHEGIDRDFRKTENIPLEMKQSPPVAFQAHESTIEYKNGDLKTFETNGVPLFDSKSKFTGYQGITRDITERKRTEKELDLYRKDLEKEVKKRTAELEFANNELEAFTYSVSHDLRAPLRALDGFSLALLEDYEDRFDNQGKDSLQRIRKNAIKMGILIDDMLKLSKITRGDLLKKKIDLSLIVKEIIDKFCLENPQRHVDIIIQPDLMADADPAYLKVAMENLLGNAWKFTSKNETSRIEFGLSDQPASKTPIYYLKDNGAGFNEAYKDKLFGVFQRLHRSDDFPGTGIGLAIVKRVIDRHGGQIWAESRKNEGSTFYFSL